MDPLWQPSPRAVPSCGPPAPPLHGEDLSKTVLLHRSHFLLQAANGTRQCRYILLRPMIPLVSLAGPKTSRGSGATTDGGNGRESSMCRREPPDTRSEGQASALYRLIPCHEAHARYHQQTLLPGRAVTG